MPGNPLLSKTSFGEDGAREMVSIPVEDPYLCTFARFRQPFPTSGFDDFSRDIPAHHRALDRRRQSRVSPITRKN